MALATLAELAQDGQLDRKVVRAGDQGSRDRPGETEPGEELSDDLETHSYATDFTLPELGENITAGDVVRVLVSAGRHRRQGPGGARARNRQGDDRSADRAWPAQSRTSASSRGERIKVGQVVLTVDDGGTGAAPKAGGSEKRAARAQQRG